MFNQTPQKIVQTNRLPFLIGIIVLMLVMAVLMYKAQMNQKIEVLPSKHHQSIDISQKGAEASWFNDDKFKNIKINGYSFHKSTPQEIEHQIVSRQEEDLKKQETEDEYSTRLEIKKIEDKNRIEEKKMEIEATQSSLSIEVPPLPGTKIVPSGKRSGKEEDLTGGLDEIISMVKSVTGATIPSSLPAMVGGLAADLNNQDGKRTFLKSADTDDDYLESSKKKPRSVYEVKAGSTIPAALITGINSDLPGNVNAQVTENVYDTVTGNYLLIPQGAKLVGEYNSDLSFGQKRVQVVWNRIIFPDGQSIDLEKMQGSDIAGYTGFYDKVDNHYLRIYGNAILLSLMGAGYDILNRNAEQSTDPRETVAASVGQKLADVSGKSLEKNMDVQPTLIIDPGYKFKIMVMKDMILENIEDAQGTLSYTT